MAILLVLTTLPSLEEARQIGTLLVVEELAACANLLPAVESIYRWKGELETATETMVLIKTTVERYPAMEARLREVHPYEVPEIVAFSQAAAWPPYAAWVSASTGGGPAREPSADRRPT